MSEMAMTSDHHPLDDSRFAELTAEEGRESAGRLFDGCIVYLDYGESGSEHARSEAATRFEVVCKHTLILTGTFRLSVHISDLARRILLIRLTINTLPMLSSVAMIVLVCLRFGLFYQGLNYVQ
jgi:hypothetical protein